MALKTGTSTAGATGSYTVTTGTGVGGAGGAISMTVGNGDTGDGGDLSLTAGTTSATGGTGGNVIIRGGDATLVGGRRLLAAGPGGDISLISGASNAGNGKIKLEAGTDSFTLESSGSASLTSTLGVTGATTLHNDLLLAADNAVIKHTSTNSGSLTISSDTSYVDVELIRFTGSKLGINGDDDIVTLANQQVTIAGKLGVSGDFKIATSKFTVDASSGDTFIGGELFVTNAVSNGNIILAKNESAITHTGSTKLVISSTNGFVDVESVRFTSNKIGINGDDDLLTLGSNEVKIGGMLEVSDDVLLTETNAALTHTAASGGLKIASTNGYVDVELVRFKDAKIGVAAQDDIITLSTNNVDIAGNVDVGAGAFTVAVTTGDTAVKGNFDVGPAASRTFEVTAADGSLAIATDKFKVAGASGNTVIKGTLDVMLATELHNTLDVTLATRLDSTLDVQGDVNVNNKFKVTASDGSLAIETDKFNVDGGSGDTLSKGALGVDGNVEFGPSSGRTFTVMAADGSLDINSGKLTVAGDSGNTLTKGTLGVVGNLNVGPSSGRMFTVTALTGDTDIKGTLGVDGATALSSTLAVTGASTLSSTLGVTGDVTVFGASSVNKFKVTALTGNTDIKGTLDVTLATALLSTLDVTGDLDVNGGNFYVTASTGNTLTKGTLEVAGISTLKNEVKLSSNDALLTHTGTTGMKITSSSGYVDVESVRFTGLSIGKDGDPNTILLGKHCDPGYALCCFGLQCWRNQLGNVYCCS